MPPSAMPLSVVLVQNNTQLINLIGLQDQNNNFVNDANLTATLLDQNRTLVQQFGSVSLAYVAASNGNYQGTLTGTFEPEVGEGYILVIDGTAISGSSQFHLELDAEVAVRNV